MDLRQLAAQEFKDVPRQCLTLQYALRKGEEGMASAGVMARTSAAIAELEMESGPEIRAGLNTISAAGGSLRT